MKEKSLWTKGKARKRFSLSSVLTVVLIVMILTPLILTGLVSAPPLPIGDPGYLQTNPFESNPTSVTDNTYIYPAPTPETRGYVKDGLLSTDLNWRIGYYSSAYTGYVEAASFESAPTPFTIGWVDIKVRYSAPATTDDRYRIDYQVSPSVSWRVLQNWVSGSAAQFDINGKPDERVWSKVAEPNDGIWDWTDIGNVKVRAQTQQQGGSEDTLPMGGNPQIYLYEVWLTIYSGAYPYSPQIPLTNPVTTYNKYWSQDGDAVWDDDEPAVNDTNMNGVYDVGVDTVLTFNIVGGNPNVPTGGETLKVPAANIRYYDKNGDGKWTGGGWWGEPAIYDATNPGIWDIGSIQFGQNDDVRVGRPPPATVAIEPSVVSGLHAGDNFFIDVFVANVAQMVGFQFCIEYDPHILTATEFFSYSPFTEPLPSAINVKPTYLYVNGFDNAKTGWTRVGASPYLETADYPTNYISEISDGSAIGDFSFSDRTSPYPNYTSITLLMGNIRGDGDDQVEIWLYDGTAWTLADTVTPPALEGDYVLVGPEPPEDSPLRAPEYSWDTFDDLNFNGTWDVGEPAIRDIDFDRVYDSTIDQILTMNPEFPPTDTDSLSPAGSSDKFYDTDTSYDWTPGEPAIKDVDNNGIYNTVLLTWTSVYVGQILNTLDKINNAKVYLVKKTVGTPGVITVDAMRINLATGYASAADVTYGGDPNGFTGSGPVLRVYFKVNAEGRSPLYFFKSVLSNPLGEPICHTASYGAFATLPADIAVKSVTPSKTIIRPGWSTTVDVTVENQGAYTETFDVTAYYDTNTIGTQRVNNLLPGNTITLPFTWSTTGLAKGSYTLSASATPVLAEMDTLDNTYTDGTVTVTTPGDVNLDGIVNIADLSSISAHWTGPPAGPLGYDPDYDINGDGAINIAEVSIISAYWTGPPQGPLDP